MVLLGVTMVLLGVSMVLLGGCDGVARCLQCCCYTVAWWLLWFLIGGCYGVAIVLLGGC